jgi:type IV fimbrial biogenesis protein FimT
MHRRAHAIAKGFTTLEILVTLSVAAILAAVAVPSLSDLVNERRLAGAASQLASDLQFARADAIKRNARVLVCARNSGASTCAATPDWANGWVVCYDANYDDACDDGSADDPNPVRVGVPVHPSLRIAASAARVRFAPIGTSGGAATLTVSGSWAQSSSRIASVATTGAVTVRKN